LASDAAGRARDRGDDVTRAGPSATRDTTSSLVLRVKPCEISIPGNDSYSIAIGSYANHTVGFCCCFVAKPLFFHALACRPFALLVAPFFTSAVAPGAKLSRPRHHALGGTSLAHRRCIPSSSRICRMIRNGPPLPVCFIMSADEAVPSQGPQGRRPRAGARPRSLRFGHVHQPGSRMHAVLVEGQRLATLPFAAPRC